MNPMHRCAVLSCLLRNQIVYMTLPKCNIALTQALAITRGVAAISCAK